ncbi:hypothetical protein Celaphus_00003448 [Cervus elaphus hippelaphus]|uniref:Transducer of regulated CREB activity N-terminal domain-containing protein n=1 Tax=Cervus elaphus hippelaphus TaxID=46360 RepID=A0A212D181_CEREH|nr:hypothetical protein Celaphus_00003448 [Cervus elaphus hippelaphus]
MGEKVDVWSEWASSTMASPSNPLKFSEKITLQKQCEAEETAAFEEVIMNIGFTQLQAQKLRLAYTRSSHYDWPWPGRAIEFLHSPLDSSQSTGNHGLVEQVQRDPRRMVSPLHRYLRHIGSSPCGPAFLSPHPESS